MKALIAALVLTASVNVMAEDKKAADPHAGAAHTQDTMKPADPAAPAAAAATGTETPAAPADAKKKKEKSKKH